jgi:hypothetical protein
LIISFGMFPFSFFPSYEWLERGREGGRKREKEREREREKLWPYMPVFLCRSSVDKIIEHLSSE